MFDAASRYVDADGLRMHYRVRGPKGGPPLLLLHGIMGNAWEWDTAIDRLVSRFRVYAPDQRGHGRTDWMAPFTAPQMGDDAAAFVRALDLWDVTLVGHSMGGLAGSYALARHPGRFARFVPIDIGPSSVEEAASHIAVTLRYFGRQTYSGPDHALAEWLAGDPYARRELMGHYVRHGLMRGADGLYRWRYDAEGLAQFFEEGAARQDVEDALRLVQVPTLVLRGQHSQVLSREGANAMLGLLADGQFREIPGAAHDIGVQQPEEVAVAVLEFGAGGPASHHDAKRPSLRTTAEPAPPVDKAFASLLSDRRMVVI